MHEHTWNIMELVSISVSDYTLISDAPMIPSQ